MITIFNPYAHVQKTKNLMHNLWKKMDNKGHEYLFGKVDSAWII